jgi:hypothetical protein
MKHLHTVQIALGAFLLGAFAQWVVSLDSTPPTMAYAAPAAEIPTQEASGQYVIHNALGDVEVMRTEDGVFVSLPQRNAGWWDDMWPPFEASPGRTDLRLTIPTREN